MPIGLREELTTWKARTPRSGRSEPVFLCEERRIGEVRRQTKRNAEARLKTTIKAADVELAKVGVEPISEHMSPHSLRRTYASLRAALRDDPVYIAEQIGHRKATFTFSVYQKAAKRREKLTGEYLAAFESGARLGSYGSRKFPRAEAWHDRRREFKKGGLDGVVAVGDH